LAKSTIVAMRPRRRLAVSGLVVRIGGRSARTCLAATLATARRQADLSRQGPGVASDADGAIAGRPFQGVGQGVDLSE